MTRHESKYLVYALAALVILVFAAIPLSEDRLIWTAAYPFVVVVGLGALFRDFRKAYVGSKPTGAMNAIQLLYLLLLTFALFLSFIVVLELIN